MISRVTLFRVLAPTAVKMILNASAVLPCFPMILPMSFFDTDSSITIKLSQKHLVDMRLNIQYIGDRNSPTPRDRIETIIASVLRNQELARPPTTSSPRGARRHPRGVLRTGAPWKDVPQRYPPYQTCHRRFQQWVRQGYSSSSFTNWPRTSINGAVSTSARRSSTEASLRQKKGPCCLQYEAWKRHQEHGSCRPSGLPIAVTWRALRRTK